MKAGQQGPQLSARVFLNHDLVTDCACVHKGMCSFTTQWQSAFSLQGRQAALLHTGWCNTLLLPSVHLQALSVSAGMSDLCVWQTRVATNTHTLSLFLCMQRGMCAYECFRDREFGWYEVAGLEFILFWFRFFLGGRGCKSHINALRVL